MTFKTPQPPIEKTVVAFVLRTINNFLKWDVLRVLYDSSEGPLSAAQIAAHTRRPLADIERGLHELNAAHVVVAVHVRGTTSYRITQHPGQRRTVDRFLAACRDRDFRLAIIQHLMRSEQPSSAAVVRG